MCAHRRVKPGGVFFISVTKYRQPGSKMMIYCSKIISEERYKNDMRIGKELLNDIIIMEKEADQ